MRPEKKVAFCIAPAPPPRLIDGAMRRTANIMEFDEFSITLEMDRGNMLVLGKVANVGVRLLAALLDSIILLPYLIGVGLWAIVRYPQFQSPAGLASLGGALIVSGLACVSLLEIATRGQTFGKNMLGIVVARTDGAPPALSQLITRNLARIVDFLPFAGLVGATAIVTSRDRTRIGDRLAGTRVIYQDSLKDLLNEAHVYESVFRRPDDGYMLETIIDRYDDTSQKPVGLVVDDLAKTLYEKYGAPDSASEQQYKAGNHIQFLRAMLASQKDAQSQDAE
ncbi:hypothetical protein CVU37_12355 [candidate division BRC1 bacterium HGW-BRC1-1]|nr:MAG: hypothetical protein CVU37_12355 [candidate division BRC1 bacterium HGW-BRC1-1]